MATFFCLSIQKKPVIQPWNKHDFTCEILKLFWSVRY